MKNKLQEQASKLYDKMLMCSQPFEIDDELVDEEMEKIVKSVGHTASQKKIKSWYKFAYGSHPEFQTLTDSQLEAITPFLKAVIKQKSFGTFDKWNGSKIVSTWKNI